MIFVVNYMFKLIYYLGYPKMRINKKKS